MKNRLITKYDILDKLADTSWLQAFSSVYVLVVYSIALQFTLDFFCVEY